MGNNKIFPRVSALAVSVCMCAAITNSTLSLAAGKHKPQAAPAAAAAQPDEAAQKQKEVAAAHASYDAGVKSYQAGRYEPAVESLSAALRGGGLSSTDMAHALFYRGVSYKKQSKPGLAISDLTSSLWLKNGLTDTERANATAERADAYRLAGLGDGNSGAETVSVADPNKTAAAKTVSDGAPVAAPQVQRAAGQVAAKESLGAQSHFPTSVADGAAAPVPRASRPVQGDQLLAAINQNQPDVTPAAAATPVLSAAPMEAADTSAPTTSATATSGASSTVSGFFSNMFGGAKANSAPPPVTTASTTPAAATPNWNDTTSTTGSTAGSIAGSVAAGKSAKAATGAKIAAAPAFTTSAAAAPAAAPAPVKGGKFKIHIAAVRSKAEAEALARKLVQQHGAALASRSPTVDEAVIGSMGTFYRVRIGSFATAEEPRGLCNTLRTSGVDCLVVTN